MKISNSNNSNWISLTRIEKENEYLPSVCITLKIKSAMQVSFDETERLWIEDWRIQKFITDLQELDVTRSGTATLESMSPEEFVCSISNLDNLGHLFLTVKLCNGKVTDEYYKLETGFEIDAGSISVIINGFRELIEEN